MLSETFYYKRDRLNQLRGFCAMVQEGSINKAATKLGVEPATISKQIKALERDVGVNLFDREKIKRRLSITNEGKEFYEKAVSALQQVNGLFNYFAEDLKLKNSKEIKIASHHTAINYILPRFIQTFNEEKHDANFTIYNIKISEATKKLLSEEIDILIHVTDKTPPEFSSFDIYDFKPVIMMHKDNVLSTKDSRDITYKDLEKQNMIMLDKDNIIDSFVALCNKHNIKGSINFINGDWESVRYFIKLNIGIHLYSEIYSEFSEFADKDIICKNVEHLFPRVKFQLITKSGKIFNESTKKFLEMIKNTKH